MGRCLLETASIILNYLLVYSALFPPSYLLESDI
ncbi:hypothetical protein ES703_69957 [subsurface metagenome]